MLKSSISLDRKFCLLGFIILPVIINILIMVYISLAYDRSLVVTSPGNALSIFMLFWFFISCGILFGVMALLLGVWKKFFKFVTSVGAVICSVLCWPLYFIFTLPVVYVNYCRWLGTPYHLWCYFFDGTCMSFRNLDSGFGNKFILVFIGSYLGFAFFLFCIVYLFMVIISIPFLLVLLCPAGLGPFGVAVHTAFMSGHNNIISVVVDKISMTDVYAMLIYTWVFCLPSIICSAVYIGVVLSESWFSILLLMFSLFYFLMFVYPVTFYFISTRSARQIIQTEL